MKLRFESASFMLDRLYREVLREYKINNAQVSIRCDATMDDIIDTLEACKWIQKNLVSRPSETYMVTNRLARM